MSDDEIRKPRENRRFTRAGFATPNRSTVESLERHFLGVRCRPREALLERGDNNTQSARPDLAAACARTIKDDAKVRAVVTAYAD